MMNENIYLNQGCPQIPTRYDKYLEISKYLSEFRTQLDKEIARNNLGIPDIIKQLEDKIDSRVIERGGVAWDLVPTEGSVDKVVSSNSLYNTFLKYALKDELDNTIQQVWTNTINKINDTYNRIEEELNCLNVELRQYVDDLRCEFDNFVVAINQRIDNFQQLLDQMQQQIEELQNSFETKFSELYDRLYSSIQENAIEPFEQRIKTLETTIQSLIIGGVALEDKFGDSKYLGINQRTLTAAFDRVWNKLSDLSGESYKGIVMTVNPEYFIGENGCEVHVTATTEETNGIFEHIEFYFNGQKVFEKDNTDYLEYTALIDETTVVMCKATIMGHEYQQMKTIMHYSSFWIGSGTHYEDIMDVNHLIPIKNGMRGDYNIHFNQGDNLFVVIGASLREGFSRADMNGVEIPFTETEAEKDGNTYKVFTSINLYNEGTYNIDVNG